MQIISIAMVYRKNDISSIRFMDVIDIVYEKLPFKMCVLCRRFLTLSVLHDFYNKKNHIWMLKLSHKVTKVLFY